MPIPVPATEANRSRYERFTVTSEIRLARTPHFGQTVSNKVALCQLETD